MIFLENEDLGTNIDPVVLPPHQWIELRTPFNLNIYPAFGQKSVLMHAKLDSTKHARLF